MRFPHCIVAIFALCHLVWSPSICLLLSLSSLALSLSVSLSLSTDPQYYDGIDIAEHMYRG